MTDPARLGPDDLLSVLAGTYLRNVLRSDGACTYCGGWTNPGFSTCFVCGGMPADAFPNVAGFMTYGANGTTAGTLMYGYKGEQATPGQLAVVKLLIHRGLRHVTCAELLAGAPVTHCSTVPSTRGRGAHPLDGLVQPQARWPQHHLVHVTGRQPVRQTVQTDLFVAPLLPKMAHVLVVDDTWTSGNKPLSAVTTLWSAGAERVSLLCLARWLSFDFIRRPATQPVGLHATLVGQATYHLDICPFTGGPCP